MKITYAKRVLLALLPLAAVVAVACSGGAGGGPDPASAGSAGGALAQPAGAAAAQFTSGEPADSNATAAGVQAAAAQLDANDVVAALDTVLANIYEENLPSVVEIQVSNKVTASPGVDSPFGFPSPFGQGNGGQGNGVPGELLPVGDGSGFVWDRAGHIVTNHHVVATADRVKVIFADGRELDAEVLGTDPDTDLAVLKVDAPPSTLRPVVLGDSGALRVGQTSAAIGNPFGREFTMTFGIISALGRNIDSPRQGYSIPNAIQTDTSINPGNSGGPLFDRQGRVIGITSQIVTRSGVNSGIGFAIPVNAAKRVVPAIIKNGAYDHAWLGVTVRNVDGDLAKELGLPAETRGVLIEQLMRDGPADRAGLRGGDKQTRFQGTSLLVGGDVIVGIGGVPVRSLEDLTGYLAAQANPGDKATLDIIRDGKKMTVDVTLGARPST